MNRSDVRQLKDWDCKKNPKHELFFKIDDFSNSLLPVPYSQEEKFNDLVRSLCDIVVRICVSEVSAARPVEEYEHESDSGSGYVSFAKITEFKTQKTKCPCDFCKENPVATWGKITVRSVAHVVWDDVEARSAKCILDFNSSKSIELQAYKVSGRNEDDDLTALQCYTHDLELTCELKNKIQEFDGLHAVLYRLYEKVPKRDLVLIVSHPHGCPKHASWGRITSVEEDERTNDEKKFYRLHYDCPTCPGSSGAPVYSLMRKSIWIMPPHKFAIDTNGGSSSVWEKRQNQELPHDVVNNEELIDQGLPNETTSTIHLTNDELNNQGLPNEELSNLSVKKS